LSDRSKVLFALVAINAAAMGIIKLQSTGFYSAFRDLVIIALYKSTLYLTLPYLTLPYLYIGVLCGQFW